MTAGDTLFLGLPCLNSAPEAVAALIAARGEHQPFAYLVTPNADHFVRLHRLPELRPLYEAAEWCCLDSRAIAHAARYLGLWVPRVATGSDILAAILDRYLTAGDRITVIGLCPEGVAVLRQRLPMVTVAHHAPPAGLAGNREAFEVAVAFALAHPARFTLLAVGSPVQEYLAAALKVSVRATGTGLCIGAGLDFWTGVTPRAPRWLRQLGLEWLYRLYREPGRLWRRYLVDDWVVLRFLLRARSQDRA